MKIPFIPAKYRAVAEDRKIDLVVLHSMESSEKPGTARQVALWFKHDVPRPASAHYCVDADEVVQCVVEDFVAYGAPGANSNGIHIEFAGRAVQTGQEWLDHYSRAMLIRGVELVADICWRRKIPGVFVDAAGLIRGDRGITTHAEVTKAFKKSTHWDPGPNFPMSWFVGRVASVLQGEKK